MRPIRFAVAAAVLALASAPLARAEAPHLKPGQWETTTTVEATGMPVPHGPMVATRCISPDETRDPKQMLSRMQSRQGCDVKDVKIEGNKMSWALECHGQRDVRGTGEMVFGGGTYEATMRVALTVQGRAVQMVTRVKGRRLGDCAPATK